MILRSLVGGPRHGYGVARWIEEGSNESLQVEEGSLYPALHRMERRGWIEADGGQSENNRRAKYYSLTPRGSKQLELETAARLRFVQAVSLLLRQPAASGA